MSIINRVESLYSFFEDKDIEMAELHYDSDGYQKLSDFNKDVMSNPLDIADINKIIKYMKNKNDNVSTYILDILLCNPSFFRNETVKDVFHEDIERRIYEDIDIFDLHGDKLKIIDLFYNGEIDKIKILLETLDYESKVDILMFIMDYSYVTDITNKETPIGGLLSEYRDIVTVMYEDRDITEYGEEIEFEGEDE